LWSAGAADERGQQNDQIPESPGRRSSAGRRWLRRVAIIAAIGVRGRDLHPRAVGQQHDPMQSPADVAPTHHLQPLPGERVRAEGDPHLGRLMKFIRSV